MRYDNGEGIFLQYKDTLICANPLDMISARMDDGKAIDIRELAQNTITNAERIDREET